MRLISARALTVALAVLGGAAAMAFPKLIVGEALPEAGPTSIVERTPDAVTVIRVAPLAQAPARLSTPRRPVAKLRPVTSTPARSSVVSWTPPLPASPARPARAATPTKAALRPVAPAPAPRPRPTPAPTAAPAPSPAPAPVPETPAPAAEEPITPTPEPPVEALVAEVDENGGRKKPKKPSHVTSAALTSVQALLDQAVADALLVFAGQDQPACEDDDEDEDDDTDENEGEGERSGMFGNQPHKHDRTS